MHAEAGVTISSEHPWLYVSGRELFSGVLMQKLNLKRADVHGRGLMTTISRSDHAVLVKEGKAGEIWGSGC